MTNAAITGHTSGLGKALADLYPDYQGFSSSYGYDISDWQARCDIVKECQCVDIIFNNAHSGFSQVELLYQLYAAYHNTDKTIVNISSVSPETSIHHPHKYAVEKLALDAASKQLDANSQCRIVLVKPGLFESERGRYISGNKMTARHVAQQIKIHLLDPTANIINIQ